jgi:hypothetical protein
MEDDDRTSILRDLVYGETRESIARTRGLSTSDILDEEAARQLGAEELRRGLCLEKLRLEALLRTHFARAMEGDTVCAALYVKTSERLNSMLGTNAPIGHAVTLIHSAAEPVEQETSTRKMLRALRRLRGEPEEDEPPGEDQGPPETVN